MWFFGKPSAKKTEEESRPSPEEKATNPFQDSAALEKQPQWSVQSVPTNSAPAPSFARRGSAAAPQFNGEWNMSGSAVQHPAPSYHRRSSEALIDPFGDAAIRPCTPIIEISEAGAPTSQTLQTMAPPIRRSSLAPPMLSSQSRRKSSTIDPFGLPAVQDHDGGQDRRGSLAMTLSTPSTRTNSLAPLLPPSRRSSSSLASGVPPTRTVMFADQAERRRSSAVDPFGPRRPSETGVSGETNFSRPLMSEKSAADGLFNTEFTLNGDRRESHSLQNQHLLSAYDPHHPGQDATRRKSSCMLVNRRASKYTIEEEKEVRAIGKKRLYWTKVCFITVFVILNLGFSAFSWCFVNLWFIFSPVILLGNTLNTIMVLNLTRIWIQSCIVKGYRKIVDKPKPPPATHIPTTIAMVLACYCESYTELMRTLDSLSEQEKVDHHKKMFIVVCDGQVKGKGMEKSTDRILVEDIFKPDEEEYFPIGYESWDGAVNGVYASAGVYNDIPYFCIVKKRNLGKRDGLILVRTLLHKYKERFNNPVTSMGNNFFTYFCDFAEKHGIASFEWLVGVDADTSFNKECIYELHKDVIADPRLYGSSGLIQVSWRTGSWSPWSIYQNTEYMRAQCLRRMHQAKGTGKVSCLPGACQIIKICEETCGDKILIDLFGQLPEPKASMIPQIRALAGEDRNYICLIFFNSPHVQTTMSMKAIAYTDPPEGVMVFLSQRKRWTLSTTANDLLIIAKNQMNWFERLCSLADVLCWGLPFFVMQTFALFVKACIHLDNIAFLLGFASITIIPMIYGVMVTVWGCHGIKYRIQYLLGLVMVIVMSQFLTPIVILYAICHMDNFAWGKTREVEVDENSKPAHSD